MMCLRAVDEVLDTQAHRGRGDAGRWVACLVDL